jgi:hypothetical protein
VSIDGRGRTSLPYSDSEGLRWGRVDRTVDDIGDPIAARPREVVGAATLARFRFQAEVAARFAFATLTGRVRAIVCEWHEDHVVFHQDGTSELVSVKHRELHQGPWTLTLLLTDGGLAHLFSRWRDTGKRSRCLLATNAGLKDGARELADACAGRDEAAITPIAGRVAKGLGAADPAEAVAFLRVLTIEAELPSRNDITAANLHSYVRPALVEAGINPAVAEDAYEAVVQAIETASRERLAGTHTLLEYIANPDRLREDVARRRILESRTVTVDGVRLAVSRAGAVKRPLLAPKMITTSTRLVRKLQAGGFGPTHIESAQRLRAAWTEFEALYRPDLPDVDDQLGDVRSRVQAGAADAEDEALRSRSPGQPYGLLMYDAVRRRIRVDLLGVPAALPVDDRLLEGLVYQLTDECPVWWSEQFDLSVQ